MGYTQAETYGRLSFFRRLLGGGRFRQLLRNIISGSRHPAAGRARASCPESAAGRHAVREQERHNAEAMAAICASRLMR